MNLQDNEGISGLHWACSAGHLDTVQLLLGTGAMPNLMEANGDKLTCLDYAIIGNHQEIAQLLIEQGALSASGIHDLAAVIIQKWVRGYLARKKAVIVREQKHQQQISMPQGLPSSRTSSHTSASTHTPTQPQAISKLEAVKSEAVVVKVGHRRELEARLKETDQKLQSLSGPHFVNVSSSLALREKERVSLHRQKTKAALIIQLAWRRYIGRKRQREALEAQRHVLKKGSLEWRRELAALIIQLAWRQYLRRKLLHQALKRQRILHEWTPSVMAAKQRALVAKVYGQGFSTVHYEPPKPKPMVRPAYLHFIPSPAALSFNFAVQQYQRGVKV